MRLDHTVNMDRREMQKIAKSFPRASVAAINRTATRSKTQASKTVRETYNIKARDFNEVTRIRRASQNDMEARIITGERRISLRRFSARQQRAGVKVTIIKGQPKLLRGRFIVPSLGGQVFERVGRKRLPIRKLTGPSVMHMMASRKVFGIVTRFIDRQLPVELDRAINHFQR